MPDRNEPPRDPTCFSPALKLAIAYTEMLGDEDKEYLMGKLASDMNDLGRVVQAIHSNFSHVECAEIASRIDA